MNNHRGRKFVKYTPGEVVLLTEEKFYQFCPVWALNNGYRQGQGRQLAARTKGKFIGTSPEGPLYKIVEINGEQFEVIHAQLQKQLN